MNEQNLPIDIHTNKLLDWVISRRHCNKEFQSSLVTIREKIKSAIKDMPPHDDIVALLSGGYIDYYHCKKIVEILKETEANSKNIFGFYSSQRMKEWNEIIKLYENDSVYLADAAQILIRNVNYEVPSLKKQINKCQQLADDCSKNAVECVKQSKSYKNDYHTAAAKLGITGNDLRNELLNQLNELPVMIQEIYKQINHLSSAKEYYDQFLEFTLIKQRNEHLYVLNHLLQKGNTTYYEYRTGHVPEIIEEKNMLLLADNNEHSDDVINEQIDFGDGIDFGETETASTESPSTGNGDFVHIDRDDLTSTADNGINWDIATETETTNGNSENGKVARGDDALSVLEVSVTRNLFINELMEIEGFLNERLHEMKSDDNVICATQFQSAPPLLQLTGSDGVSDMLLCIKNILNSLTNPKMKVLYYMKDSPKYIENVIEKLKHIEMLSEKAMKKSQLLEEKRIRVLEEQKSLEPKLPLLISKTRELQKNIENDISKRYKNRVVNIMGGVQVL